MTSKEILELKFHSNDLRKTVTVKDFFKELLKRLFKEMECFSGKRPFGNSDWEYDMCACFIKNGIVDGKIDEDGYIYECNWRQFDNVIQVLIESL